MGRRKTKAPPEPTPTPGPRGTTCRSIVHNWPLPVGRYQAEEECRRRLRAGWEYMQCARCRRHGWRTWGSTEGTTAEHWQPQTPEHPERRQRA